ncbi:putative ABC transport system ATP-binding protein [Paenibacillus phyllosphaerae]|uniref:Putative ABC transport system ATP-binding protein n=1 Tax=Paenibacillus phyllosphaerae TaxID=274593 RepID=A0A7W5B590_9BACL|nr:ABC transporter ATP-binding protein [Paenibacillus phyllosphaerae]MBB3114623.1 putative ABC transport system ATP-binding protein [Paenibacillus phyllosphaerae]
MNGTGNPGLPLLEARGVTRVFGKGNGTVFALKGASLNVDRGRLIALKGRSGSGKTTLLNIMAALDSPTEGTVLYGGRDGSQMTDQQKNEMRKREIGLIFQSFALVPYMTAYENVEFGLRIAGIPTLERKMLAEQALSFVGLANRMHHMPPELSGGEQQRTAIARAIAHKPKLILADEPTAELDSRMGKQVMQVFRELVRTEGIAVVLTTHDPHIMELVDDVYALEDGRIGSEISKEA